MQDVSRWYRAALLVSPEYRVTYDFEPSIFWTLATVPYCSGPQILRTAWKVEPNWIGMGLIFSLRTGCWSYLWKRSYFYRRMTGKFNHVNDFKRVTPGSRISKTLQNGSDATFSAIVLYHELGWFNPSMAGCCQDGNEHGVSVQSSEFPGWLSDS